MGLWGVAQLPFLHSELIINLLAHHMHFLHTYMHTAPEHVRSNKINLPIYNMVNILYK